MDIVVDLDEVTSPKSALEYLEDDNSALEGNEVDTEEEAYKQYLAYSYIKCFGIRFSKLRTRTNGEVIGREFCCEKEGWKVNKGKLGKEYTKVDRRTGCKANIYYKIQPNGKYLCVWHNMVHNHPFCRPEEVNLMRCHRQLSEGQLKYIMQLRNSGVPISSICRSMAKEAHGSPNLPFQRTDVYTAVNKELQKQFLPTDSNGLLEIFKNRQQHEEEFYFDFQMDPVDNTLISLFWRDKGMKADFLAFGDLLVFDTTYRTNRYDMICAPFVGVDCHAHNCMFGCGFLLNEKDYSFDWLFGTFKKSMDGKEPQTVMTDQAFSMALSIAKVFPRAKHRLCVWHIMKNSQTAIGHLRELPNFCETFDYVLKHCHGKVEHEYYWTSMEQQFNCANNDWLQKLYKKREKWCPAYNKEKFSAGALSSQRAEVTNNAVSHRISKTTTLCEFYNVFCDVIGDWRRQERIENDRCRGVPEVMFPGLNILENAARVLTVEAYKKFEKRFVDGMKYSYEKQEGLGDTEVYLVWISEGKEFAQTVTIHNFQNATQVQCSCKRFEESGFLCQHILRVCHSLCVKGLSDEYLPKRWSKTAKPREDDAASTSSRPLDKVSASVWRMQANHRIQHLLYASDSNDQARKIVDDAFENARKEVESILGTVHVSDSEVQEVDPKIVRNPRKKTKKGERNIRKRSVRAVKISKARGRHRAAETRAANAAIRAANTAISDTSTTTTLENTDITFSSTIANIDQMASNIRTMGNTSQNNNQTRFVPIHQVRINSTAATGNHFQYGEGSSSNQTRFVPIARVNGNSATPTNHSAHSQARTTTNIGMIGSTNQNSGITNMESNCISAAATGNLFQQGQAPSSSMRMIGSTSQGSGIGRGNNIPRRIGLREIIMGIEPLESNSF